MTTTNSNRIKLPKLEWTGSGWRAYVWDADLGEKVFATNPQTGGQSFPKRARSACRAAQRRLHNDLHGLYVAAGSPLNVRIERRTFEEVAREWLPRQGNTPRSKLTITSATNVLCRWFGEEDINDITEDDYRDFMRHERDEENRAPATLENRLVFMRQIMKFAWKKKYLDEESAIVDIELPKVNRRRDPRVMSDQEHLLLECYLPWWFRPAAYLGYDAGLRAAEVAGLRWKRLILDGPEPKVFVKDVAEKDRSLRDFPKGGGDGEWVVLSARCAEALKLLRDFRPDDGPDDRVFRTPRGALLDPSAPSRILKNAWIESGLPGDAATFHSYRHSRCTNLARAGVEMHVIMKLMRHKNPEVTMRYIKEADMESQVSANAKVDEMHVANLDAARTARAASQGAVVSAVPGMVLVSAERAAQMEEMEKKLEALLQFAAMMQGGGASTDEALAMAG